MLSNFYINIIMAFQRVKSFSDEELEEKKEALKEYLQAVEEEILIRSKKNVQKSDNVYPLKDKKSVKKSSPKKNIVTSVKKSSPKKSNVEDIKNRIPLIATIKIMKQVLDEHDISYKSNLNKDQLEQIVRNKNLLNKCNDAYEKDKKAKK